MGTRHAIIVKGNGKILVQQYGQWDGYFSVQGIEVVEFVKNNIGLLSNTEYAVETFRDTVKIVTEKQARKLVEDLAEVYKKNGFENTQYHIVCPSLSRDTGAKILDIIKYSYYKGNLPLYFTPLSEINSWCEYVYILDLDNQEVACLTNHEVNNAITYACPQVTEKLSMECFAKLSFAEIKKKSVKTITKDIKAVNPNLI